MNIVLICNAGMSTGIMQLKLQDEINKRSLDATVKAVPMVELDEIIDETDAILLAPQIRFAENDIRKLVSESVPVVVISAQDFGLMNVKKVLDDLVSTFPK